MVKFDWLKFCTQYKIHFVTRGPNVSRGNAAIKCPFCGESDPSEHLGLSLEVKNPVWGCLRNPQHRGRDPRRLIQRLLHCGYQQALSIVKTHNTAVPDDFETLTEKVAPEMKAPPPLELTFPKEFRPLDSSKYAARFLDYLAQDRGFGRDALEVCSQYDLMYALTGEQAWRIIFPIRDREGKLRNWTGRAVQEKSERRYKNASDSGKGLLFNEDRARAQPFRIRTLFVVEGPMDCIKVDFYGRQHHCACVAILGTSITAEQMARLALLNIADRICILMDPEAFNINLVIEDSLAGISQVPVFLGHLPDNAEDPGALTPKQVGVMCSKYSRQGEKALL